MTIFNKNIDIKSFRTRSNFAIIIIAAVLIAATNILQYVFARKGIRDEVAHLAQSELSIESAEIQNMMSRVEVVVNNLLWAVEHSLDEPDAMYDITRQLLNDNPIIVGSAIAFTPNYYSEKGYYYSPYCYRTGDSIASKQLGNPDYDYFSMEWFTAPTASGKANWSEPYFDKGGGEMMMSTYSAPIHDWRGRIVGVFTADVSLEWLASVLQQTQTYPSSFNIVVSRTGKFLACPTESLLLRNASEQMAQRISDTTINRVNSDMVTGQSGQAEITDEVGEKQYIFYTPIGGNAGWSMAVVCSDSEIYSGLRKVTAALSLLMLFGFALLGIIIRHTIRGYNNLQLANSESERINSQLRIAHAIQVGMLPKIFPAYPDRNDIDIYAYLQPAKEVGGDLYDFHLRNEKLFFCIGDVSGKGVPASLLMAVTRSLFLSVIEHEARPNRIVENINRSIVKMNDSDMFVTFFVGVLDLPTGRFRYCNAAHCQPILISENAKWLPVETNIPIGVSNEWNYVEQEIKLQPHSSVFLYTDGLTEAERADLMQFGRQRLIHAVQQTATGQPAPQPFIEHILQVLEQFTDKNEQNDDIAMLAVHYTPQASFEKISLQRNLIIPNRIEALPQLHALIDEITRILNLPFATANNIDLALEEAIVNIVDYAYPEGTEGKIELHIEGNGNWLKFVISDNGIPFDPTSRPDVDIAQSIEDRPIGGLGIHLIRNIMSEINYERADNRNILTLTLNLNPAE